LRTVFTTLAINHNFRTKMHKDSGDLKNVMSCIAAFGQWTGGELVFPQYGLAVALAEGDVAMFDPHEFHANLPMVGNRTSVVFYAREKMDRCEELTAEVERAAKRKRGTPLY
jgi:hypothetical protein